jgi:glycosyltransferase involved in cell wall biosynthesis
MKKIAVIIPAFNEELTIKETIVDYHKHLSDAEIYVVDNNSSDLTNELAKTTITELGCRGGVFFEKRLGKGNAMRKAFCEIDSDIYIMVDADLTYPAKEIKKLIEPVANGEADIAIGDRHAAGNYRRENKRRFHNFGNWLVKSLVNVLFRSKLNDVMSGCRVLNKFFVENYPIMSSGFELETEMTIHALDKRFDIIEIPIEYRDRQSGSISKLNTMKDGVRVIKTIFFILKDYKPLLFFSVCAFIFGTLGLVVGIPVIIEFLHTRYILRVPSAILATGYFIISLLLLSVAFILDTTSRINRYNYELRLISTRKKHCTGVRSFELKV